MGTMRTTNPLKKQTPLSPAIPMSCVADMISPWLAVRYKLSSSCMNGKASKTLELHLRALSDIGASVCTSTNIRK